MRLIDVEKLQEKAYQMNFDMKITERELFVVNYLCENSPTIEAEPIRHGKWEVHEAFGYKDMTCSVCGWLYEYYGGLEEEWNYCPHCGETMDEVNE